MATRGTGLSPFPYLKKRNPENKTFQVPVVPAGGCRPPAGVIMVVFKEAHDPHGPFTGLFPPVPVRGAALHGVLPRA